MYVSQWFEHSCFSLKTWIGNVFRHVYKCTYMLKAGDFSIFLNSSSRQQGFPWRVTLENLIFSPKQPDCPRDCHEYLMNILTSQVQRFTLCRINSATSHFSEIAYILEICIGWHEYSLGEFEHIPAIDPSFIYLPPLFAIFLFPLFLYFYLVTSCRLSSACSKWHSYHSDHMW